MKKILMGILVFSLVGCGPGFQVKILEPVAVVQPEVHYFPVASATINVASYGQLSLLKPKRSSVAALLVPMAYAQAQGSATINVTYNNPSATTFTINTAAFGNSITVVGNELNLGSITLAGLDDNTLRVCTGVGAPQNKCNRLYIRIFTLGTAAGGAITATSGFINTGDGYGIDVLAGSVLTPIGFNASATAASVTNAATVYTYTIPNNMNRVRLSNLSPPTIPIKADLTNAGNGAYEMNLVVQYALGYQ